MNTFVEHFVAADPAVPYLGPRTRRVALVQVICSRDIAGEVRKWEEAGFVQAGTSGSLDADQIREMAAFCREAAALGASIVIHPPVTARQHAVYLAPTSLAVREAGERAPGYGMVLVELADLPPAAGAQPGPLKYTAARIKLGYTDDPEAEAAKWEAKGFVTLGSSDHCSKSGEMGFTHRLSQAAVALGATVVLFHVTPAKLRAVRRDAAGRIDMAAVRADPPASFSPRSYSLTRAVFLAPTSIEARDLAESAAGMSTEDVPIALED